MKSQVALVAIGRTAFGPGDGNLADLRPDTALAAVMAEVHGNRLPLHSPGVDLVVTGTAAPEFEQSFLSARSAMHLAGLAENVPGYCLCAGQTAGLLAVKTAMESILSGRARMVYVCGMDFTSRVPPMGYNPTFNEEIRQTDPHFYTPAGLSAEHLVSRFRLTREELDRHANDSRRKAALAGERGLFQAEIVAVKAEGSLVRDDQLKPTREISAMAAAEPLYIKGGCLTRLNCAHLASAAACLALCPEEFAREMGLSPLALLHPVTCLGGAPARGAETALAALETAAREEKREVSSFDLVEVDEATAALPLAVARHFGLTETQVNPGGGSLAFGNALGTSGLRMVTATAAAMERNELATAIIGQYGDGGLAVACVMEKANG